MDNFITWEDFVEAKSNNPSYRPPQGKGANPYMPMGKHDGKIRVAKDSEKKKALGELGGSNVEPSHSSLGMPGGKGGVGVTEAKKGSKVPYPGGKVDGRIRVSKEKEKGKKWGDLKTPGIEPSTSSLGKEPEKGVGTTTEENLSTADFIEFVLKKKDMNSVEEASVVISNDCELDDDFVDDFTGRKVYVSVPKVLKRAAKAMVAQSSRWPRIFVRELKKIDNGIPTIMDEILSHNESFDELAQHIHGNENKCAKKLVKSMNKHYLDHLEELGMMESVSEPMDVRLAPEPKSEPEKADEQFPGASLPGMAGPSMAGPTSAMGVPPSGGPSMGGGTSMGGGGAGGLQGGPFGGGGTAMAGGPASPGPGEQPGAMNFPGTESKKEFGYHHLIKEMGNYDNMKNAMKEYLEV